MHGHNSCLDNMKVELTKDRILHLAEEIGIGA